MDAQNEKGETLPAPKDPTATSSSKLSIWVGLGLLIVIILLVVLIPCPSQSQYLVFRIVIALAAAGIATIIPGFINLTIPKGITAGGAIALFALIYFFDPASGVAENKCTAETFALTVFVHGPQGKEDKILRGQGEVCVYLNSNPEKVKIDEDGKAIFTEISPTFLNSKVRITVRHPQPYQSTHSDSLYLLQPNGVVYLEAALNDIDKIFGRVTDATNDDPLDSVKIVIKDVHTFSNTDGWFEMEVPKQWQSKFQRVSFSKKGYVRQDIDSIPVHTKQEIQVSLKKK
ncbi:MAG: hypothetical protein ABIN01_05885 [Ferruginibacter sp.]